MKLQFGQAGGAFGAAQMAGREAPSRSDDHDARDIVQRVRLGEQHRCRANLQTLRILLGLRERFAARPDGRQGPLVALIFAVSTLAVACSDSSDGDCELGLRWNASSYFPLGPAKHPPALVAPLGRGEIIGCPGEPGSPAAVSAVERASPAIAVGAETKESGLILFGAAGYVPEHPRHPLHDTLYGSPNEPDATVGYRCRASRSFAATATSTPRHGLTALTVRPSRAADDVLLSGRDGEHAVVFDARTTFVNSHRGGIPFVEKGDDLTLRVRLCRGTGEMAATPRGRPRNVAQAVVGE